MANPIRTDRNFGRFLVDSNPGIWFLVEGLMAWLFFSFFASFGKASSLPEVQLLNRKGAIVFAISFALLGLGLGLFEKENRLGRLKSLQLISFTTLLAAPTGLFILYLTSFEKVGRLSLLFGSTGATIGVYVLVHFVGSLLLKKYPLRFILLPPISKIAENLLLELNSYNTPPIEHGKDLSQEIVSRLTGRIEDDDLAVELLRREGVSVIVINWEARANSIYTNFLFAALRQGMRIIEDAEYYSEISKRIPVSDLPEYYIIKMGFDIHRPFHGFFKRMIDIVIASTFLIVLSPLFILASLIIRAESPGAPLYFQRRSSRFGTEFKLAKFRTMCNNADTQSYVTTKIDKRITKFGHFLRITHFDELPQLWNILIGDMSIVGPRPLAIQEVDAISKNVPLFKLRHIVRPGLTGLAQISQGKTETETEEMAKKLSYDLYYVRHFSVFLDLWIMSRTVFRLTSSTW